MNPSARALLARFTPSEIAERCVAAEADAQRLRDLLIEHAEYNNWGNAENWEAFALEEDNDVE